MHTTKAKKLKKFLMFGMARNGFVAVVGKCLLTCVEEVIVDQANYFDRLGQPERAVEWGGSQRWHW